MEVPDFLVAAFPPSLDGLLDAARRDTDDAMLMDIARADYGEGANEVMPELRAIRDTGIVRDSISSQLYEVLTLTHYSNPEVPEAPPLKPGPTDLRGPQTCFFTCALLLYIEREWPREYRWTTDSALANGIVSAKYLDEDMSAAVGGFLTWRLTDQVEIDGSDAVLLALALLILATRLRSKRFTESNLGAVASWVLVLESFLYKDTYKSYPDYAKFWLSPFSVDAVEAGFWRPHAEEFKREVESIIDDQVRSDLELCGLLLNPNS